MRYPLSRTIVALLTVSLIGCTSMQTVAESRSAPISASQLNSIVTTNDSVIVTDIAGKATQMKIVSVTSDAIEGTVEGSANVVRLQLDQIRKIERRSFDGTKTTILVVALIGGLYLIIQAAGAAASASFIG